MLSAENSRSDTETANSNPQIQVFQDTWLLILFAVVLATCLPWFVSSFDIDFVAASWALLLLGGVYVGMSLVASAQRLRAAPRRRILAALHALAIVVMGYLWLRAGGLQNPVFLLVFILPIFAANSLSRWQPYASAALAVLAVSVFAVAQAPELRWYTAALPTAVQGLMEWLVAGAQGAATRSAFPGFYAPVGYDVVLLEVFAILIFACAIAAESLGSSFERLLDHLSGARSEAARSQDLWETLMQQLPVPALLVDAESLQIVFTSGPMAALVSSEEGPVGKGLFDTVRFSYPERVQEIVTKDAGVASGVVIRTAQELRMVNVRVQHVSYEGRRLALVLLEDTTAAFCAGAALDAEQHPVLVINALGRVMTANKSARVLFPDAEPGSEASRVLARIGGATRSWWEPGLTGRRRVHLTLGRQTYLASCTAMPVPGENEGLCVVEFAPLLPVTAGMEPIVSTPQ